jgi:hypothetical protein
MAESQFNCPACNNTKRKCVVKHPCDHCCICEVESDSTCAVHGKSLDCQKCASGKHIYECAGSHKCWSNKVFFVVDARIHMGKIIDSAHIVDNLGNKYVINGVNTNDDKKLRIAHNLMCINCAQSKVAKT